MAVSFKGMWMLSNGDPCPGHNSDDLTARLGEHQSTHPRRCVVFDNPSLLVIERPLERSVKHCSSHPQKKFLRGCNSQTPNEVFVTHVETAIRGDRDETSDAEESYA
jgi:hypothetical protein